MVNPPFFSPDQICGDTYSITRLYARSLVTDSYIARHVKTGQEVILTCSPLDHGDDSARLRSRFLANAAMLKATRIENAPKVAEFGLSDGVYWIAREHYADAILLAEVLSYADRGAKIPAQWKPLFGNGSYIMSQALALSVGLRLARILGAFAAKGIVHGGLDLRATIAVRDESDATVLDTGYGALFGLDHFTNPSRKQAFLAPERIFGHAPSEQSDIYSVGVLLKSLIVSGAIRGGVMPPEYLLDAINRMTPEDPKERAQRWEDVHSLLEECLEKFQVLMTEWFGAKSFTATQSPDRVPQSETRKLTSRDSADTDRSPPPVESGDIADDIAPSTTPSRAPAAPTPRVPELPTNPAAASRLPLSSTGVAPSKGAARARRRWTAPLAIAASAIFLALLLRLVTIPTPHLSDALPALRVSSAITDALRKLEAPPEEPAKPAKSARAATPRPPLPVAPRTPRAKRTPSPVWRYACDDFVICSAKDSRASDQPRSPSPDGVTWL